MTDDRKATMSTPDSDPNYFEHQVAQLTLPPGIGWSFINAGRGMRQAIGESGRAHGFWHDYSKDKENTHRRIALLALIAGEAHEAIECVRSGTDAETVTYEVPTMGAKVGDHDVQSVTNCNLADELADIVIRAFDFADQHNIAIEEAIVNKHRYNLTRPPMHGKKA